MTLTWHNAESAGGFGVPQYVALWQCIEISFLHFDYSLLKNVKSQHHPSVYQGWNEPE